jgi:(R,R)-butanediol dehydrogenase / meso-butanediol dehydrogenase / diacetyl reductase
VRVVEIAADRSLVVSERESPEPGEGQVLVGVSYCGICGSDLHFRDVAAIFPDGSVPGHEFSGRIEALGDGVSGWSMGDRVSVVPFAQCGECEFCVSGNEQVCVRGIADGVGLGSGRPGGYAEHVIVDAAMLVRLPDSVDDRAGALVEPLAVALHSLERSALQRGEDAIVIGAGTIGLLTALVLREHGIDQPAVVSRNPSRAEKAAALGLRAVSVEEARSTLSADPPAVVFECAGSPSAAQLALELVKPLGRVVLVGIALEPLDLPAFPLVAKEVDLRGALIYRRSDFVAAIELLSTRRIPVEELVTGIGPLEQAEELFQELTTPGNRHVKVLLRP